MANHLQKPIHQITQSFKTNCQAWYGGYAFQGAVALGLAPIFLPLYVGLLKGSWAAGLVVALFYFAQMFAPFFGWLIDKLNCHRAIYITGYILIGCGAGLFTLTSNLITWLALAFVQGLGIAATNTASGMLIIEFTPKPQWDLRIGWLQTLYGTGQALGLLIAALLGHSAYLGLYVAGILMAPGLLIGIIHLPKSKNRKPVAEVSYRASHAYSKNVMGLLSRFYSFLSIKHLIQLVTTSFGIYILMWFFIMMGNWLIYNLYPLLMQNLYHIQPTLSSLYYGLAAGVGIIAYPTSGWLAKRIGESKVLIIGILMCLVSVAGLSCFAYWQTAANSWLVPLFFIWLPIAWSPLIVVGTALVTKLSALSQGESLGIFNGTTAFASFIAALVAGFIAKQLGFAVVVMLSLVATLLSLILMTLLAVKTK